MKFQDFHVKRESRRSFCKHPLRSVRLGSFCNRLRNCLNRIKDLNCFKRRPRVATKRDSAIEVVEPMGESQDKQRGQMDQAQELPPQGNNQVMGARSWSDQRKQPRPPTRQPQQQYTYSLTPTTASMMFSPATAQGKPSYEEAVLRDHIVRLKSLKTDLALNLPHTIALPDGEEYPGCNFNHIRLHNAEQQAEMMNNYIKPPPNRTISNCTPVPYFTANSVGHFPKHPILTLSVPRFNYGNGGKGISPGDPFDANLLIFLPDDDFDFNSIPGVAANAAGSYRKLGANGNTNGMDGYIQNVTDNPRVAAHDPPPSYKDVVSKGKRGE